MYDPGVFKRYGFGVRDGEKQAVKTIEAAAGCRPYTVNELWYANGKKGVWVCKYDVNEAVREQPSIYHIPIIHLADRSSFNEGEFFLIPDTRNLLEMRFYGVSWLAFPNCPVPIPEHPVLRLEPLLAAPVFEKELTNQDTVGFFDGVGVSIPSLKFPLCVGKTYWMLPQREDYLAYGAEFALGTSGEEKDQFFDGFPFTPIPLPFVIVDIHISRWGLTFTATGDPFWMQEHPDWFLLHAEFPGRYPYIYQTLEEAAAAIPTRS